MRRESASATGLRWVGDETAGKAGRDLRGGEWDGRKGSLIGSRRSCRSSLSTTQTRHAHVAHTSHVEVARFIPA
jgi:hypothetical protein